MNRSQIAQTYTTNYNPTAGLFYELAARPVEKRAHGTRVFDEQGKAYLDFAAGYGVFSIGHTNSEVAEAVEQQLAVLGMAPPMLRNAPAEELAVALARLMPPGAWTTFLAASGTEAVEIALRTSLLARKGRTRLVAAVHGYHGKTTGALGLMGQAHLRAPFEPLWSDVQFVPYGNADAMAAAVGSGRAAAVILEPVLGGGYLAVPPSGYLAEVRALCDRAGTLLLLDEIQTGFARTGKMFAFEHAAIVPDIVLLSKGITGGHLPIAAAVMRSSIADAAAYAVGPDPYIFVSETDACPLAAACAVASLKFIVRERLAERSARMGEYLQGRLREAIQRFPEFVSDVPGIALMTGATMRNSVVENAAWMQLGRRGVVAGYSTNDRTKHPVMRFFPPLTVTTDEIDVAVDAFLDSLQEMRKRPTLIFDLANLAVQYQYAFPRPVLKSMMGLIF